MNEVTMAVQVNGKMRGTFTASADASDEELTEAAKQVESVQRQIEEAQDHPQGDRRQAQDREHRTWHTIMHGL